MTKSARAHTVLSIVIPALNEEEAIGSTVERCLAAREAIAANSPVDEVELIVVSDGSTDDTESIARRFDEVTVLAFDRNRGYGAAIKAGFAQARGDLLGFLDADGTCDPLFFADLCNAVEREGVDVALGSRMGPQSEMPLIRTVGNTIFAWILGLLSKRTVRDTASGMRVIRRSALSGLYPLPDGLHFTPAMSARLLLDERGSLVEVPMTYAERVGRSKLSVARDGARFLTAIVQAAMCYQPARPLLLVALFAAAAGGAIGFMPVAHWLRLGFLEEWMVYRILFSSLLFTVVAILFCAAIVADRIASAAHDRQPRSAGFTGLVARLFTPRSRRVLGSLLVAAAVAIVWPGIVEYLAHGTVHMHWSRAVLSSLLLVVAVTLGAAVFLLNIMGLIHERQGPAPDLLPPDRVRPGGSGQA